MHNLILVVLKFCFGHLRSEESPISCWPFWQSKDSERKHAIANVSQDYFPPVSLLKPLCGIDPELGKNLETFFRQDYRYFEILFAVRDESDPSVALVQNS